MLYSSYFLPQSISQAIDTLINAKGEGIVFNGGTDLIIKLKDDHNSGKTLIDLSHLKELKILRNEEHSLAIGSGLTFSEIQNAPIIKEKASALVEAAASVGSAQIRNIGTIGGNVVSALPAADSAIVLVAFDAESEIIHDDFKISKSKVADLYLGQGESRVDTSKSILTRFIIKLPSENYGSAFYKITNRKALAMPVLNCVAVVGVEDDYFTDCRIVVAPVAPIPFRMRAVEDKLIGKKISADIIEDAAENSMNMSNPRNSRIRGSMEYRKEMVKILVRRTLIKAIERARNR